MSDRQVDTLILIAVLEVLHRRESDENATLIYHVDGCLVDPRHD